MINETDIIRKIGTLFPRSAMQLNRPFEADAELIRFAGKLLAFNIDEYSGEDLFREHNPRILGQNLTIGALSDILAVGGEPLFFAHSLTVGRDWDEGYILQFCRGVQSILASCECDFIGGDFGKAESWKYTATVIGRTEEPPLMRKGAAAGEVLYLSGEVGRGNCEAILKLQQNNPGLKDYKDDFSNQFQFRYRESQLIRRYATSCIDTSDGLYKSLNALGTLGGCGYRIERIPYLALAEEILDLAGLPAIMACLGESGEYELLFSVPEKSEPEFLLAAAASGFTFHRLGSLLAEQKRIIQQGGVELDFTDYNIHARDFEQVEEYIQSILKWLAQNRLQPGYSG